MMSRSNLRHNPYRYQFKVKEIACIEGTNTRRSMLLYRAKPMPLSRGASCK